MLQGSLPQCFSPDLLRELSVLIRSICKYLPASLQERNQSCSGTRAAPLRTVCRSLLSRWYANPSRRLTANKRAGVSFHQHGKLTPVQISAPATTFGPDSIVAG